MQLATIDYSTSDDTLAAQLVDAWQALFATDDKRQVRYQVCRITAYQRALHSRMEQSERDNHNCCTCKYSNQCHTFMPGIAYNCKQWQGV